MKNIEKELKILRKQLEKVENKIYLLPHGKLRCSSSNGTDQYFVDGKYVSKKDIEFVKLVAQREYYEHILPLIRKRIGILEKYNNECEDMKLENYYYSECFARQKLVDPIEEPMEMKINKFLSQKYEIAKFAEDDMTERYTNKGERVRSKSEQLIANELLRYNVPYLYEKPLELIQDGKVIVVRPDFTIMNKSTGKVFIHEHLGMMDSMSYVGSWIKKWNTYERNGYLIGENLIITHETSFLPLSVGVVDSYIEDFYL